MSKKRVLLLGGTGAMGVYLAPELIRQGYKVDVTTRSPRRSGLNLNYIQGDAHDNNFLEKVLENNYDVVVDFMVYSTDEFAARVNKLLEGTRQYVFLSTYRVFANAKGPIVEDSQRLLDVSEDKEYLATDEYALAKARQEDILRNSGKKNWTIVRPSITYSKDRFQLGVLEANVVVYRSMRNLPIAFPDEMLEKETTMTWAGDVAKMITGLLLKDSALGEDFNVVTSSHCKWKDVIEYYQEALNLKVKYISLDEFLAIYEGKYQVMYDRMYNRIMDNTKVLQATGLKQGELTELRDGLTDELAKFIKHPVFVNEDVALNAKIDAVTDGLARRTRKVLRPRTRLRALRSQLRPRTRLKNVKAKLRPRTRVRAAIRTSKNRKKSGLIVSLDSVFNHGNIVQRYALKTFLHQQGYDFDNLRIPNWSDAIGDEVFGNTRKFVDTYIGGVAYNPYELQGYRNYIVGSDQVWRDWYAGDWGKFSIYFLDFVKDSATNRVAYAASFGVDNLAEAGIHQGNLVHIRPLVEKFRYLSVRETSGVELAKDLAGDDELVELVADPTLLLTATDYSKLIDDYDGEFSQDTAPRVFCYIVDLTDQKLAAIQAIAKEYGDDYGIINPKFDEELPSIEEWLRGFRDADLVITDSFHGTVFAVLNNKNFIVFSNAERGGARFESLFEVLEIDKERLVYDITTLNSHQFKAISWKSVNKRLTAFRARSGRWLMDKLIS